MATFGGLGMKKINVILIFMVAITALLACPMRAVDEKTLKIGMWIAVGTEFDAQNKQILSDVITAFSQKYDMTSDYLWFTDKDKFTNAIKNGKLDIIYTEQPEYFNVIQSTKYYTPLVLPSMLGIQDYSICLFVNTTSKLNSIDDLKGKNIQIALSEFDYFALRSILPDKPEYVFRSIEVMKSGFSSIYALAMNDIDVAFISTFEGSFMKMNNPGPLKKIKPILCTEQFPSMPVFVSKKLPDSISKEMSVFLFNIKGEEGLKKYRPIFNTYKLKFVPVNLDRYKPILNLLNKSQSNGWNKDYETYKKIVKKREK
jgi:ABC-type phosphate/phosphonate transport system substrate-binding protein